MASRGEGVKGRCVGGTGEGRRKAELGARRERRRRGRKEERVEEEKGGVLLLVLTLSSAGGGVVVIAVVVSSRLLVQGVRVRRGVAVCLMLRPKAKHACPSYWMRSLTRRSTKYHRPARRLRVPCRRHPIGTRTKGRP